MPQHTQKVFVELELEVTFDVDEMDAPEPFIEVAHIRTDCLTPSAGSSYLYPNTTLEQALIDMCAADIMEACGPSARDADAADHENDLRREGN